MRTADTQVTQRAEEWWADNAILLLVIGVLSPFLLYLVSFPEARFGMATAAALLLMNVVTWRRQTRRRYRLVAGAGTIVTLTVIVLMMFVWVPMLQHDRLLGDMHSAFCEENIPLGSEVLRCGGYIENPSNGNQCGYFIDLQLRTNQSEVALARFYSALRRPFPPPQDPIFFFVEPQISLDTSTTPATAMLQLLAVGDEGGDPRCN
jgi:hypothetical protein